jgi:hypothetical protein
MAGSVDVNDISPELKEKPCKKKKLKQALTDQLYRTAG